MSLVAQREKHPPFLSVGKFCQDQITQSFFIQITEVFIEKSESHARD